MAWVIDQWVGPCHHMGWGHLLLGHSLSGVKDGVTHVIMESPILRTLVYVQTISIGFLSIDSSQLFSQFQPVSVILISFDQFDWLGWSPTSGKSMSGTSRCILRLFLKCAISLENEREERKKLMSQSWGGSPRHSSTRYRRPTYWSNQQACIGRPPPHPAVYGPKNRAHAKGVMQQRAS